MPALPSSSRGGGGWPRPPAQDEQLALLRRAVLGVGPLLPSQEEHLEILRHAVYGDTAPPPQPCTRGRPLGRHQNGGLLLLQAVQAARDTREVLSLDVPMVVQTAILSDDARPLGDVIADPVADFEDEVIERVDRQQMLDKVIGAAQLSLREGYIVAYRMGIAGGYAHSLEQVGAALGITRERVRQIEKNAICKLRKTALLVGYGEEFGTALCRHECTKAETRVDVVRVKKSARTGKKAS